MPLVSLCQRFFALLLAVLLASCGGGGSSATPPVGGLTAVAGGSQVTLTWQADPGVDYWLVYVPANVTINMTSPPANHVWVIPVTSPYVLTGLTEGTTYSFAINGRVNGGPGGPQTPTVTATPRPAGGTWSAGSGLGSADMHGVSYGTASDTSVDYVAVGSAGSVFHSLDGLTWNTATNAPVMDFKATQYMFSEFVAVGVNDPVAGHNIYLSTDMQNWTAATNVVANTGLNALTNNGTTMVAVGNGGVILYSNDGNNWTAANATAAAGQNLYGVAYSSNGLWVAVGANGMLLSSPDAVTWTKVTIGVGTDLNAVTSYGGLFMAVGNSGAVITSSDGVTWTQAVLPNNPTANFYAVTQDNVQYLVMGSGGLAYTSPDAINWTANTTTASTVYGIYGNQVYYIAVGAGGTVVTSK